MTNRKLAYIIKDQTPLALPAEATVGNACRRMSETGAGSVLVTDGGDRLAGILTGRDAVRLLAEGADSDTRLAQAMTRDPVTVAPSSRALDAVRAMCEGGFRHVPVTEDGKIRGVVSRGDFKGMEFECYRWPDSGSTARVAANRELGEVVSRQMTLALTGGDTVRDACKAMWRQKAGSVLVVDDQQRLVGIFTGRDAIRALARGADAATARLADVMTAEPAALGPKCLAIDALRLMCDGGFRHVPVVENGRVLGVVSRNDFTGVEIDRLDEEEHLKECIW